MRKNEVGIVPHINFRINSKYIEDLKRSAKTMKLLENNIGININSLGLGNNFLNMAPKKHSNKKINWTSKFQTSEHQKTYFQKKVRRQYIEWGKNCKSYLNRNLYMEYIKNYNSVMQNF